MLDLGASNSTDADYSNNYCYTDSIITQQTNTLKGIKPKKQSKPFYVLNGSHTTSQERGKHEATLFRKRNSNKPRLNTSSQEDMMTNHVSDHLSLGSGADVSKDHSMKLKRSLKLLIAA